VAQRPARDDGGVILHITTRPEWDAALADGAYRADTLATEGFIHASTHEQVLGVAQARFRGTPSLVLLVIDESRIDAELRWEESEPDLPPFPHIYGPLNVDAVVDVVDFPEGEEGFALPPAAL
jgi:uncharacterized protein (DUF952 family)